MASGTTLDASRDVSAGLQTRNRCGKIFWNLSREIMHR